MFVLSCFANCHFLTRLQIFSEMIQSDTGCIHIYDICINIVPWWIYQISKSVTEIDVFVIRFLTGSTIFSALAETFGKYTVVFVLSFAAVGWSKVNINFGSTHSLFRLDRCRALLLCSTLRKLRRPYIAITRDRFHLFDGSVVRIWIGSYFDPSSPASNSDTELGVKETKSHAVDEGSTQGRPSESRTADPPFFAPVSSATQMMLLLILIWCEIRKQRCWKAGFSLKVQRVRRRRRWRCLRLRSCRRSQSGRRKAGIFFCLILSQTMFTEAQK